MKVNIVMLVKDRARLTFQALKTLYLNTPNELFNLTIINDASESVFHWDALEKDNLAVLTNKKSKGITGQARNLGVYWAEKYWGRGDYLCLLDNDLYFAPDWLVMMIGALESVTVTDPPQQFTLIGGWNHPFLQPGQIHKAPHSKHHIAEHDAIAGASQLMRWSTWDKYGPLDAHTPGVCKSEDWQFCQNIIKGGGRVGSIYPRVIFNCGLTNSFGEPSVGADHVLQELQQAKITYPDLYWE